jgi:two-component system sensor histidine kinase KdpD
MNTKGGGLSHEKQRRSGRRISGSLIQQPRLGYLDRQSTGFGRPLLALLVVVTVGTAVIYPMRDAWGPTALLDVVYVPGIVVIAIRYGFWWALATIVVTIAAFDYAHVEPVGQFTGKKAKYVDLAALAAAAALVSFVARRATLRAVETARSRRTAALLGELSKRLLPVASDGAAREVVADELSEALGSRVRVLAEGKEAGEAGEGPGPTRLPLRSGGRLMATLVADDPLPTETLASLEQVSPALAAMLEAVSRRVELERKALDAEALRRSDTTKTAILRAVSHDFRSPLTALSTAVEVLREEKVHDAARREMVQVAAEATTALRSLVDNVLDLARLEAGAARPEPEWVSIEEVLARALAGEPGLRVRLELEELPLVRADPVHLERAFANLLQNARRHAAGLGVTVSGAVAGDRMLRIEVADEGPGVHPSLGDAAFEPFRSGDPESGTGLGLAIVRGFLEANGGRVRIGAAPEGGASIVIELPIEEREAAAAPQRREAR